MAKPTVFRFSTTRHDSTAATTGAQCNRPETVASEQAVKPGASGFDPRAIVAPVEPINRLDKKGE